MVIFLWVYRCNANFHLHPQQKTGVMHSLRNGWLLANLRRDYWHGTLRIKQVLNFIILIAQPRKM